MQTYPSQHNYYHVMFWWFKETVITTCHPDKTTHILDFYSDLKIEPMRAYALWLAQTHTDYRVRVLCLQSLTVTPVDTYTMHWPFLSKSLYIVGHIA